LVYHHDLGHFPIALTATNWGDDIGIFYNAQLVARINETEIQASGFASVPIMGDTYYHLSGGKFSTQNPVFLIEKDLVINENNVFFTNKFSAEY
jgi:hypothetical protein